MPGKVVAVAIVGGESCINFPVFSTSLSASQF